MLVYKYRGGSDEIFERDLSTLKNYQFWASRVEDLNDPFEAMVDLSIIDNGLIYLSKKMGFNKKSHFTLIKENNKNVFSLDSKTGIYSMSKNYTDELLWTHYSEGHKGFCIEYELDKLIGNNTDIIDYFSVKYNKKLNGG